MMPRSTPFSLKGSDSVTIHGDLWCSNERTPCAVVTVLHGFRVHKDWGFYPTLYAMLVDAGYCVISLNFSHNGYAQDTQAGFDVEAFASNTVAQELQDASVVLESLKSGTLPWVKDYSTLPLFVLGHSRGAGIALLLTKHSSAIQALALWSPLADFDRYTDRQKKLWHDRRYISAPASAAGPGFRMDVGYLADIEQNQQEYSLTRAMKQCEIPVAMIVGSNDLATPPSEAEELFEQAQKDRCSLTIIPQTGHTFGTTHPFSGSTKAFERAVMLSVDLFDQVLQSRNI